VSYGWLETFYDGTYCTMRRDFNDEILPKINAISDNMTVTLSKYLNYDDGRGCMFGCGYLVNTLWLACYLPAEAV
jgi:hypothetical protein